ncbi:MAG: acyltransferase [Actinomycetota bacterium]
MKIGEVDNGVVSAGAEGMRGAEVPAVFRPPPGNPRFPLFDGLRAMAALGVLLYHSASLSGYTQFGRLGAWTANLNVGVTIFFVISGFLLYRPYIHAQLTGTAGPNLTRFYRRRLLRIVPAYWVALTLLSIYPGDPATFADWPRYYLFLQVYTPSPPHEGLFQAWSLCVEMSFYLLLPLYAFVTARIFRSQSATARLKLELALLIVLSIISGLVTHSWSSGATSPLAQGLPRFMFWFALGMGLALVSAWQQQRGSDSRVLNTIARRSGLCWTAALGTFLLLGALTRVPLDGISFEPDMALVQWFLCGVIALLIAVPAVARGPASQLSNRILSARSIVWLGLVSYGIFLWQMGPLTVLFDGQWTTSGRWIVRFGEFALIAAALTIPLAAISYYVVERPFLRMKDPSPRGHFSDEGQQ